MTDFTPPESLTRDDLDAAVAEGIVTAEQASALRALAERRERERAVESGHEERFRFMRGFNDFFFAVGIALFAAGMAFFALPTPAGSLIAVVVTWLLAELLVARMRLVLPGILLAGIFVGFVMVAAPIELFFQTIAGQLDAAVVMHWVTASRPNNFFVHLTDMLVLIFYSLVGAVAAAVFYARFRLPFALLLIAACLVGAALAASYVYWPRPPRYMQPLVLLGCGFLIFSAAMAFDFSDRERLTRRADCAFWLHLLAAPLIVHSLITLVTPDYRNMTTQVAWMVLAIFAVLTIIAVVIDRRALLVSGLIYIGVAIAYAIAGITGSPTGDSNRQLFVFFSTLLVLGTVVLTLGVGWRPLRRLFLRMLPAGLGRRLPPVATAT